MNQPGPQGQQAQNNPQAAQLAAAQLAANQRMAQAPPFYKPEQMRNISILNEEEKTKYERGLTHLWRMHDTTPAGSVENNEAKKKILEFGKMLTSKMQARRLQIQQQQQAQLQQRQASGQQPQTNPQTQTQTGALKTAQSPGAGAPPTGGNVPPTTTAPMAGNTAPANPAAGATQAAQQQQQQQLKVPEHLAAHVNQLDFNAITPPAQVTDKAKWAVDLKTRYTRALLTMESTRMSVQKIEMQIRERTEKGNPLSADEQKNVTDKKAQLQKAYSDSMKFVGDIRKQLNVAQQQKQLANGAQPTQPGAGAGAASNPMQSSTATVNAAIEAAKNQQLAAAGRLPGQQQGQSAPAPPPNAQAQSPALAQGPPSATTHQAPAPHPQQQQPPPPQQQQQRPVIKTEPGTQPASNPIPAPLNTAIASSAAAAGLPSAGTPTQNSARVQTPQSATPTNGAPRALSHTAALNMANKRTNSVSTQGQPGSAPGSGSGPPSGPGMLGGGQQGHAHAHPPQPTGQTLQSKLPIPKVLPEKATQGPTPVSMGGMGYSRPTYSGGSGLGGGVMGQPAVQKTPVYQLEGEGERVLNKKKLDELVRQVCGGTAEGQEGNLLTPEVEESVLNLADSFVDNVLHTACRNAKERGSRVLEIRDIQLVLERTYNIRIPGYSSEELRTVRKIQPSPAWITKMSAVQAAKVMPGKGDL